MKFKNVYSCNSRPDTHRCIFSPVGEDIMQFVWFLEEILKPLCRVVLMAIMALKIADARQLTTIHDVLIRPLEDIEVFCVC